MLRKDRLYWEFLFSYLENAEIQLIIYMYTQCADFLGEWARLSRRRQLSSNSRIIGLRPKIYYDGLMRSEERLQNAMSQSYDVR